MRTIMITVCERTVAVRPWIPWVVPGAIGGGDALNIISPPLPLYLIVIGVAVAITTSTLVCRRLSRIAERAQVDRAMLMGYQAAYEHCDEHQTQAQVTSIRRPMAVGEITLSRRLQPVQPTEMPTQPTRRAHLASAPPPQPQP